MIGVSHVVRVVGVLFVMLACREEGNNQEGQKEFKEM